MRDESGFATIRGFGRVLVIGGVATVVVVDYGGGIGDIVLDVCYVYLHEGVACAWVSGDLNAAAHLCCGFLGRPSGSRFGAQRWAYPSKSAQRYKEFSK